ncbi:MAG: nucleotide exchange factor GrpE [Candidatus Kerfeldbacteria bacterium]|nr:nucleotide exchange factor GrpE [Candidatus Kerfeldbacteria bacterium]
MPDQHPADLDAFKNEVERLQAELDKANARAEENLNGWKRAKADYINLKRDAEREKTEMAGYAVGALMLQLLPIADDFDRAISQLSDGQKKDDWVKGILHIKKQLQTFFSDMGLQRVATDVPFNPEFHEAVAHEERPGVTAGTILEVVTPGYLMHGKLLRPAKVKVAK